VAAHLVCPIPVQMNIRMATILMKNPLLHLPSKRAVHTSWRK